jgi:anti-anti-sigma factor
MTYEEEKNLLKVIMPPQIKDEFFLEISNLLHKKKDFNNFKLDLRNIAYMNSKNIAALINLKKVTTERGINFTLLNVRDGVYQVLEIADLLNYFIIEEDYSSYSPAEMVNFFLDPEKADFVSDYISSHYSIKFKEKIHELFNAEEPVMKEYAILTAGKAYDISALEDIRCALNDEVQSVVRAAALVVGWLNDIESKNILYKLLKSEYVDVVEASIASIALMPDSSDTEKVSKLLASDDSKVRSACINAIGLINDDRGYQLLMEHLHKEKNNYIRALIVRTLSFYRKDGLSDYFVELLDDEAVEVQEAASSALVRIKACDKVDALLKKVSDENSWVAYFAVKAIGSLCNDAKCIQILPKDFKTVDLHVKIAIVETVGKIGMIDDGQKQIALPFINDCLENENEDIRKEALNSLFMIDSELALRIALKLFENDSSCIVRLKSLDIIERIKPRNYKEMLNKHLKVEGNRYIIDKIEEIIH